MLRNGYEFRPDHVIIYNIFILFDQAIGRIRRYGQTRKVNVWRYLAKDTIDIEIYSSRKNDGQSKTPKKEELTEEDIDMDVDVDEME